MPFICCKSLSLLRKLQAHTWICVHTDPVISVYLSERQMVGLSNLCPPDSTRTLPWAALMVFCVIVKNQNVIRSSFSRLQAQLI